MQAAALALLLSISGCGLVSYESLGSDADGGSSADAGSPATPTVVSVPNFSTSSSVPVAVPGSAFTIEPEDGETWLVLFSAQLSATSTAAAELIYRVDGAEAGLGGAFVLNQSTGPWQHFYLIDDGRPRTFEFELAARTGEASLANLQAVAIRLPAGADPHYAAEDTIQDIAESSFATLAFTPSRAGDYVVLATTAAEDTSGGDLRLWMTTSSGTRWPAGVDVVQGRLSWQSQLFARVVSLPAEEFTIDWQANTIGAGSSRLAYARILAFRTDAFASAASRQTTELTSHDLDEVLTIDQLPFDDGTGDWLVLQNLTARVNVTEPAARIIELSVDGETDRFTHVFDHLNMSPSYSRFSLRSGLASVANAVRSPDLQPLQVLDSSIIALLLP